MREREVLRVFVWEVSFIERETFLVFLITTGHVFCRVNLIKTCGLDAEDSIY